MPRIATKECDTDEGATQKGLLCVGLGECRPRASTSVAVDELVAAFIMRGGGAAWALGRSLCEMLKNKISEHVTARFEGQRTVGWLSIQRRPADGGQRRVEHGALRPGGHNKTVDE